MANPNRVTMQQNNTDRGTLQVNVVTALQNRPVAGARVTISYTGEPERPLEELTTDQSGHTPDLELVRTAAQIAQISGAIESMPLGYHTEIQEMGANISGGQRQRIAVARAIARRPKMIVLDEATSALDNMTERDLAQRLAELNSAQIVIAHRKSTIRSADRILVLRGGHLVQQGAFSELMAEDGEFRELMSSTEDLNATSQEVQE